jgi:hypothetical protein
MHQHEQGHGANYQCGVKRGDLDRAAHGVTLTRGPTSAHLRPAVVNCRAYQSEPGDGSLCPVADVVLIKEGPEKVGVLARILPVSNASGLPAGPAGRRGRKRYHISGKRLRYSCGASSFQPRLDRPAIPRTHPLLVYQKTATDSRHGEGEDWAYTRLPQHAEYNRGCHSHQKPQHGGQHRNLRDHRPYGPSWKTVHCLLSGCASRQDTRRQSATRPRLDWVVGSQPWARAWGGRGPDGPKRRVFGSVACRAATGQSAGKVNSPATKVCQRRKEIAGLTRSSRQLPL